MRIIASAVVLFAIAAPLLAPAQTASPLRPYITCKLDDGLTITDKSSLPSDVEGRTVATIAGPRKVPLLRGELITLGYPATDPFANLKVEQLPPDTFEQGKADLIANFDYILAAGNDGSRNMNYAVHPTLNGFEIHGLDRITLDGKILGIYLLIDNATHIVTTANFLNQGPLLRKFSTLDEYAKLRDHFLNAYTICIHTPSQAVAVRAKVAVSTKTVKKSTHSRRVIKPAAKAAKPRRKIKPQPHSRSTNTSAN